MLLADDEVVGANLAFYSERTLGGRTEPFCNLGALCVREDLRSHAFRLVRAVLKQRGYHFTDLSPSGNVVEVNLRLGFVSLDTTTVLTPNLPWPAGRVHIVRDLDRIAARLEGRDRQILADHREAPAARHLLLVRDAEQCYVVFRRDRRKQLPLFASILHVGNPGLYRSAARAVGSELLLRHGVLARLAEVRVVGGEPGPGRRLRLSRPKMFKSATLTEADIDYLYSELTCVPW